MFRYLILAVLLAGSRCQNHPTEQSPPDASSPAVSETFCYRQVIRQDTTFLKLTVKNGLASGYLAIRPYEKDQAQGPFTGTFMNNNIRASWQRSGEGTTQAYRLDFTLHGGTIAWYEGEREEKEGIWVLKTPKTGYQYVLTRIPCP